MRRIKVNELAAATLTRGRGAEAFAALAALLPGGPVEVVLDGAELLSASFLDEIVRQLALRGQSDVVTFVTDHATNLDKLARIAANREAKIYARGTRQVQRTVVEPRRVELRPTFTREKVEA